MDARFEATFAKAAERMSRIERVVATNNSMVTRLTRCWVSDARFHHRAMRRINKCLSRSAKAQAKSEEQLVEIEDKLDGLIDIVDKSIRRNGR